MPKYVYQKKATQALLLYFSTMMFFVASPQVASSSAGDCAFEDDMCGWTNPGRSDNIDELDWERLEARGEPRYPKV